jgi:hypothetical protein
MQSPYIVVTLFYVSVSAGISCCRGRLSPADVTIFKSRQPRGCSYNLLCARYIAAVSCHREAAVRTQSALCLVLCGSVWHAASVLALLTCNVRWQCSMVGVPNVLWLSSAYVHHPGNIHLCVLLLLWQLHQT